MTVYYLQNGDSTEGCDVLGKKRFVRITLHGGGCYIQPPDQIHQAIDGEMDEAPAGTRWTLEIVEMTQAEYDALPEFTGH